ncbi:RNA polymerase 2 mediator complex component [Xylogone sp. PMI_703]|nr:RNA polymerase 2 mediator complex component [Xylogone sp. PMI_703]
MPKTQAESNACSACARSKRKCGRQLPSCARCVDRGRTCIYPPSRNRATLSSRPLLTNASRGSAPRGEVDDGPSAANAGIPSSHSASLIVADDLMLDLTFPLMDSDFAAPSSPVRSSSAPAIKADWFLAPETWRISHGGDTSADVGVGRAMMKKYITLLQSWFHRWVTTGNNPFIHPRLYSASFPACVQVAYATLASYIHRTPTNTDTILQIIEDRSNDLLQENGLVLTTVGTEEWIDGGEQDIDLFAQLTRLHALMVYQIIGLFDGDIRSRHVAQGRMAVQDSWANKLVRSAGKSLSNTHAVTVATNLIGCLPGPSTSSQEQWYLWILSETIRRTWLVAVSITPIFSALQQRWAACPGGVMYTNRSGLWDATSATEWEKQCSGRNVAFLQRFEYARLLNDMHPADIDEFGTAILNMTCGEELLQKWRDRSGDL